MRDRLHPMQSRLPGQRVPCTWLLPALSVVAAMLPSQRAHAQSAAGACPSLPAGSTLTWSQLDGPGFVFCKALRSDGGEAFAVTLSKTSPFKPSRGDRAETGAIGGQKVQWYRSELASRPTELVRETLVEVDANRVAHITLQATSTEQLASTMQLAEAIDFADARLGSN